MSARTPWARASSSTADRAGAVVRSGTISGRPSRATRS